jgi:hypothetical protein
MIEMENLLQRFDALAEPERGSRLAFWLDRIAFGFLILMVLSAPHSIAATQTAWLTGMLAWMIRLFIRPRPVFRLTPIDIALWALFLWSAVSAVMSYDPAISIDRLRGVALFLIFYFVYYNIHNRRALYFVAFALIFSCMFAVGWTPIQKLLGRGIEVYGVSDNSPLAKAKLGNGDTLLSADGKKIRTPEDLSDQLDKNATVKVSYYRPDFEFETEVRASDMLPGSDAAERLGITGWKRGRVARVTAFYGHYTTLSEALQLIASLTLGLFAAAFLKRRSGTRRPWRYASLVLLICVAGMCGALLLTITRASQLGFLVSSFCILVLCGSRKLLFAAAIIVLPVAIGVSLYLQQSRTTGFFDPSDPSTQYRETMWRDGYRLWTASPRNFVFGIGMDSTKTHWREWGMFEGGKLPIGHFHSTPVQFAVERGLPALIIWLVLLIVYGCTLWPEIRRAIREPEFDWRRLGILLGCFGGMIGFFTGGLVHNNIGDAEVAMLFYLLMGLGIKAAHPGNNSLSDAPAPAPAAP